MLLPLHLNPWNITLHDETHVVIYWFCSTRTSIWCKRVEKRKKKNKKYMNWYLKIHLGTFNRLAYYSAHTQKRRRISRVKENNEEWHKRLQRSPQFTSKKSSTQDRSRFIDLHTRTSTHKHKHKILQGPVTEPKLSHISVFVRRVKINNNIMMGKINQKSSSFFFFSF